MAVAYLTDGATNLNAASWSDGTGFADSATLVISRVGSQQQAITGISDTHHIQYLRIERPFTGIIGSESTPITTNVSDTTTAQKKTTVVGAGGNTEAYLYYGAGSGSIYVTGHATYGIDNLMMDSPGNCYVIGGLVSYFMQANGASAFKGASTLANGYIYGGSCTLDLLTSGSASTAITIYGGTVYLNRAGGAVTLNGGKLIVDNQSATATTSITQNGGELVLISGDITTLNGNASTMDASNANRAIAITTYNRSVAHTRKGNFYGGLITLTNDVLIPFQRAI